MAEAVANVVRLGAIVVEGQFKPWLITVSGKVHEEVCGLCSDRNPADFLKPKCRIERLGALQIKHAVTGVDESHGTSLRSLVAEARKPSGYAFKMIIERSEHSDWYSNTWLVADEAKGNAVLIDAGGPVQPLLDRITELGVTLDAVLLTHHHYDHIAELTTVLEAHPGTPVLAHPIEREVTEHTTGDLTPGERLKFGNLEFDLLLTPGHTAGMVALVLDGETKEVFTGDTLFLGSVGGVRAPGHTTFRDLRASVMDTLLTLPPETIIRPGHSESSTVADELENNAFVRIWRGVDPEGSGSCKVNGEPAELILLGPDYDGGHKAWVRWPDGSDDLVPGSVVER